ncbi:MAG: hypothetical protein Q9227_008167 [Pyrenula ochraceoflavens]
MTLTPPATTLTPRSPTAEIEELFPAQTTTMKSVGFYLVVATSIMPSMGIGNKGALPWPNLKRDMAFFSRITKRAAEGNVNAVIMGRRTWESIPERFRPLADRWNIVLSRDKKFEIPAAEGKDVSICDSFGSALTKILQSSKDTRDRQVEKVFVIGGSEVYRKAIEYTESVTSISPRVVQTQVRKRDGRPFECDTFFPSHFTTGWRYRGANDLSEWVGEAIDDDWGDAGDKDGLVEIKVQGWEQENVSYR